ncbi:MAG: DUF1015 domain-containing protein [Candidatus Rokubacteria bacterium]|nr:DUF1015 domain-containing protein [Candidatus Rokubacteria bacterium]
MRIKPFRGYRYALGADRDVSTVVAPPYDQITPETRERLHAMSPRNIVRLTLPRETADKYARARRDLAAWLEEGAWAPEAEPAIYPYHQTYTVAGREVTRTGFVALGEASEYGQGVVLPHERTHAGPKKDRLELLEATRADIGLLFMLVSDPGGELLRATTPTGPPIAEAHDLRGEAHRLWRITDGAAMERVRALMAPQPVVIADGHHRYESAVEYARHHPEAGDKLMAFFTLEAPGLTILPNHRLVHGVPGFAVEAFLTRARAWFDVAPLGDPLAFRPGPRTIGVVAGAEARVLTLRADAVERIAWPPATSRAWRELAVSILHEGLLKPLLGIAEAELDARTYVDYTADQAEAVRQARLPGCQAAFLIAPPTPEELVTVVRGGELMPQKSTHFYPKLLDGLVFHLIEQ